MQLILYSPANWVSHRISTHAAAHIGTHHDVVGLTLLLLPRHPLVSDDQEIGEAVASRSMTRHTSGSPGLMQAIRQYEIALIEMYYSHSSPKPPYLAGALSLVTINP